MKVKEAIHRILYYISVPKCVYCKEKLDYDDRGLCKACAKIYREHKKRNCSRCSNELSSCFCSSEYLLNHGVKNICKVFRYSKSEQSMPSNYLIYSLKQDNRSDVISFLSDELVSSLRNNIGFSDGKFLITSVPRRPKAILNFGFDHAAVLAKNVAKKLGVEYRALLVSKSTKPQKSVMMDDRVKNVRFDYKRRGESSLKGCTVIIVDDIITTGASMSACATLIKAYRPKRIIGASLGIAYKDSPTR